MKEWEHWPSLEIPGSVAGNCHLLSKLTVPARHPDAEAASFWPDRVQRRHARQDTQAIPRSAALVNISPEIAGRLVIRQNPSIVCCRFFRQICRARERRNRQMRWNLLGRAVVMK
jgi:hypothetical protein